MIQDARRCLELEMGVENIAWSTDTNLNSNVSPRNVCTPKNVSPKDQANFDSLKNDRKRKLNDARSPDYYEKTDQQLCKKIRITQEISSGCDQISDQFTCVRLLSSETVHTEKDRLPLASSYRTLHKAIANELGKAIVEFSELNIVNVFDSLEFFNKFKETVASSLVIGVSIGVNRDLTSTPIIGENILMNQLNSNDDENADTYNCTFDDNMFIAGVSLCLSSTVYYLHFQNETKEDDNISFDMKVKFLVDLFHMEQLTIVMYNVKEQCKTLVKAFPQLRKLSTKFHDPRVANWLLQPDIKANLLTMVSSIRHLKFLSNNKTLQFIRFVNMLQNVLTLHTFLKFVIGIIALA